MSTKDTVSPIEPILCIAQRFETIAQKYIFQPIGFSQTSMHILQNLKEQGPMIASDLIEILHTSKSNMSQRIAFLEKKRYIKKTPMQAGKDKRKVLISLTLSGRKKIIELESKIKEAEISFEKKFSAEELKNHKAFFKKIEQILDDGECELMKIFK